MHVVRSVSGPPSRCFAFIHQVPSSHMMWRRVIERLALSGVGCVAVDLPGFGFSTRPATPPSIEACARSTATALRASLVEPCLIVGHHGGCDVAVELANQDPALVYAVAGWGIPLVSEQRRRQLSGERIQPLSADGSEIAAYWNSRRARPGASANVVDSSRSLTEWLLAGDYAVWGHRAVGEYDLAAALRALRQPLLGMAGEQEDLYQETRRAADHAPDGRFVSLGPAGIDVADTFVVEFCDALVQFDHSTRTRLGRREGTP